MSMFCYQCEQSAGQKGCEVQGVCGKTDAVALSQDRLTIALIALAKGLAGKKAEKEVIGLMKQGLFTCVTNVNFDEERVERLIKKVESLTNKVTLSLTETTLWEGNEDIVSLRSTLLLGMRGMAAYAWHASLLGYEDEMVNDFFVKGLSALDEDHSVEEWVELLLACGKANYACMALLDKANTETYGTPVPTEVSLTVEPGPFIVVTGHDLHDLSMLLAQTEGTGVSVYTHGEMLPCHGYPELKKYSHFKGHFGTAWQNQQVEFDHIPGALLYTTNCLMVPRESYKDNIFTTDMVAFPGVSHIPANEKGEKDFTPLIEKAKELGGYKEAFAGHGINGGTKLTTGFGHGTVLSLAETVIEAVKSGAIKHFFLVGGCDGAKVGRNYYTEFVKETPTDTVVLTLACGKFRFNDLDLGTIGGIPRLLDMGQCNDAYSAIQVALALSEAFGCGVNDLPLSLVLSWYEQKAVAILLTLLSLGIKNMYLGPTLPKFLSPTVLQFLVENYNIHPISTPKEDMAAMLGCS